jgi:ATP-dependent RNA helicase DHX29
VNGNAHPHTTKTQQSSTQDQTADQIDVDVSDLDSDLELDELIPAYLKIKGKIYEIDPSLVETTTRKPSKGAKSKKAIPIQATNTPATRKLLSQLQQITSDPLFDDREAEAQWPAKRNQIAQDKADKRQEQADQPTVLGQDEDSQSPAQPAVSTPNHPISVADQVDTEDEADLLGGMFTAVPDEIQPRQPDAEGTVSETATLRDFGKSSGLTPRRLLEEAVRSRLVYPCYDLFTQAHFLQGSQRTLDV